MARTSKQTVKTRESVRLDDDVRELMVAALGQVEWKNKSRLFNAALRHSLARYAGKRIQLQGSDFERKVFGAEKILS